MGDDPPVDLPHHLVGECLKIKLGRARGDRVGALGGARGRGLVRRHTWRSRQTHRSPVRAQMGLRDRRLAPTGRGGRGYERLAVRAADHWLERRRQPLLDALVRPRDLAYRENGGRGHDLHAPWLAPAGGGSRRCRRRGHSRAPARWTKGGCARRRADARRHGADAGQLDARARPRRGRRGPRVLCAPRRKVNMRMHRKRNVCVCTCGAAQARGDQRHRPVAARAEGARVPAGERPGPSAPAPGDGSATAARRMEHARRQPSASLTRWLKVEMCSTHRRRSACSSSRISFIGQ